VSSPGTLENRIIYYSRLLYDRSLVSSKNGNVSTLTDRGTILVTPSASCIGLLEPGDLVEVDMDGRVLAGKQGPSLELPLHMAVYKKRREIGSVVHAHPPYISAFSLLGRTPFEDILPEFVVSVGHVEFVSFALPGSPELASMVGNAAAGANALVLANHGAITVGRDLEEAYMRMEDLEHTAKVQTIAEALGDISRISIDELQILKNFKKG